MHVMDIHKINKTNDEPSPIFLSKKKKEGKMNKIKQQKNVREREREREREIETMKKKDIKYLKARYFKSSDKNNLKAPF